MPIYDGLKLKQPERHSSQSCERQDQTPDRSRTSAAASIIAPAPAVGSFRVINPWSRIRGPAPTNLGGITAQPPIPAATWSKNPLPD